MKDVEFLGASLDVVRAFPQAARREVGFQIERLQNGLEPDSWKPMKTIGKGVRELRVRQSNGAYRVIYLATRADVIYVLHAFEKKTQATQQRELELAIARFRSLPT